MLPFWPCPASNPPGWQESLQTQRGQLRERATERARKRLRGQESEEDRERRRARGGTEIDRRRKQGGWDKGDKVMNRWWGTRQKAVHTNASCYCDKVGDKVAVLTKTTRPDTGTKVWVAGFYWTNHQNTSQLCYRGFPAALDLCLNSLYTSIAAHGGFFRATFKAHKEWKIQLEYNKKWAM